MAKRYSISRGRSGNGSFNYGIDDNMPPAGSDGRVLDCNDQSAAEDYCTKLNQLHEANSMFERLDSNREWRYNGRCYSWETIREVRCQYID
jgi:hypothetical protein